MKAIFTVLEGIGIIAVLFGIACIESASTVPIISIIAGSALFALGYKGESQYVTL